MKQITDFDHLTQSTRRKEFEDGLADYLMAGIFLILSLFGWLIFSPEGMRWYLTALILNHEITTIGLILVFSLIILMIFGAKRIVERLRLNIIWRDSGFVKTLRWQVNTRFSLLAGAVTIVLILGSFFLMLRGLLSQEAVLRAIVSSAGIATGIIYFGMGGELRLQPFKWVGITGGVGSAIIFILPVTFSVSWLLLGVVWIAVLFLSGTFTLRKLFSALEE